MRDGGPTGPLSGICPKNGPPSDSHRKAGLTRTTETDSMAQATDTPTRFIDTPEYRRLVYRWMRREVRLPHPGGRISKWTATKAWKMSGQYVEALR